MANYPSLPSGYVSPGGGAGPGFTALRDISLDVAGLISKKIGGPSVFPPLPPGIAELSYAGNFKWDNSKGEDRYRRGMYTFFKRTGLSATCVSNTPLAMLK